MEPYPQIDAVSAKIQALGIALPRGSIRVDKYGDSEELSQKLLQLIREGKKRIGMET